MGLFYISTVCRKSGKGRLSGFKQFRQGPFGCKNAAGLEEQFDIPDDITHNARVLDRYYIESRYPNGFPEGSPFDYFDEKIAKEAHNAASKIFGFCEDIISKLQRSD
jgi:hypothetical protein